MYLDVEQICVAWLPTVYPGVRACTELPADLAAVLPVVRFQRIGGPSSLGIDQATVDWDVFDVDKPHAKAVAAQIQALLETALSGTRNVGLVETISGPSGRPYADINVRSVGGTARITLHAPALT